MTELKPCSAGHRILVLGGPGAGKTTLARQLSQRLGVPRYCLDDIGWRNHVERSDEEKRADIDSIGRQAGWVVDGVLFRWSAGLAEAADTIMWLDVPWRVAGWRIVKRHVLADVHRTNQHPGYRRLWKFLVWSRWFYTAGPEDADAGAPQDTRWGALQLLEGYREKLICTAASGLALELVGGRSRFQR